MPQKQGLVLVKKEHIEACISAIETRALRVQAAPAKQAGIYEMFDKALANLEAQTSMTVKDGLAIIPVKGSISLDDPFAAFFGETTIKTISENLDKALGDPAVKGILLAVNSPGGYVSGVEALSNKIYEARKKKPIYAYTESLAASAAYWIGSAATKLFVASETSEVGSIGVYMVHFDYSGLLTDMGIKVTEVTAGEYKGIGSPYAELTEEDKKILQADANFVYTRFVEAVARNRGISAKEVLKSANGLTFFGSDAKARGLNDGIATQQEVIAMTKEEMEKKEAEEKAAAKAKKDEEDRQAEATKLAAATARAEAAEKELAELKAKEAEAGKAAIATEAQGAYKAAFGREATKEEVDHYVAMTPEGRKVHKATLEESAKNRKELATKAGLFKEIAEDGQSPARTGEDNLILKAAQELKFA